MNFKMELEKRLLFFDGAMGTMLQQNGLAAGELPELWNLTKPDLIAGIHRAYLRAGCDIIKTNTFGANRIKLAGCGHPATEIIESAVRLARNAVNAHGAGWVAMDISSTGKLMRPMGDLGFEDAVAAFREAAECGERAGADCILIETLSDTYEAKAALLGAKEGSSLPVFVTLTFDENGKLLTGGEIESAAVMLEGLGADAIGLNCGIGPAQMMRLLPRLLGCCSIPVIANPNAGMPRSENGAVVYDISPEEFASHAAAMARMGVRVLGGCCGTTPEHIAALTRMCSAVTPVPITEKRETVVSSHAKTVVFGNKPVLIGERINPTGKPLMKQALRDRDWDYLLREGLMQQANGAHILDLNVGLPEIDEAAILEHMVIELQGITDLPLQIDTADSSAMERALRVYNGKPLINSVNGKAESMKAVFPLVKKYGGAVIALTLDEMGIPPTAEGRLAIAEKIVRTATEYGISSRNIIVDPLALTISAGQEAARVTLDALRLIKEKLGLHTSLGVSNISFGLPHREHINASFFTMAMQNGLSAAILNPASQPMMQAYDAYCALSGADAQCSAYLAKYAGGSPANPDTPVKESLPTLSEAVMQGLGESARRAARELLQSQAPLPIINEALIPALDRVGKDFENGTLFLPQLLRSAEAAKAAFEVLREHMTTSGQSADDGSNKIVLATVLGDIHDIGKNIVKVLLYNYGYQVIDLGKDVPPERIVEAVRQDEIRLVGLSALMTTTVSNMEETIRQLRTSAPDCRVMVGGAVLTPEYAQRIGADHYSRDAMSSVRYAEKIFSVESR